jgi:hypothetical protein
MRQTRGNSAGEEGKRRDAMGATPLAGAPFGVLPVIVGTAPDTRPDRVADADRKSPGSAFRRARVTN